ncbi:putative hydrolase of the HAD superfamily [Roseiarcus fermentans]|uniref:Putative hydrolase of the HAD superfamily n=1 Tax=Roseiarcus fermentans TaxID=1473586 RepID=A0A366F5A3_9HYPH|nr:pyrimidine 5'-nucleotidase [Roseiarcus fermentans]RBP09823.1 putative hydrolase of the HAD superfamily [Roseiarcus fermentans]
MGKLGAISAARIAAPPQAPAAEEELRARFGHVTTWVFDLDNTLYPADSGIWPLIDERITLFLIDLFGLDGQSARALHQHYYLRHGTTLRGLVEEDIDEAERFLEFVHDIDRSILKPNPTLVREVARLAGRKLIFTNGSRNHAILTARQIGLDGLFEDAFDIVAAGLTPKPGRAAYDAFFERYGVDPASAAMFEDVAKNLVVPKALGMTTVLVTPKPGQDDHRQPHDRVSAAVAAAAHLADVVTDDLGLFLGRLNDALA